MNYLNLALTTFNIVFTCFVAQKVLYPQTFVDTETEEVYGECETVEVVEVVEQAEVKAKKKSKTSGWYSDNCETQTMYALRAKDHVKRGLITLRDAQSVFEHYDKVCYR